MNVNPDFLLDDGPCRICGCSYYAPCVDDVGGTCEWVGSDLCSFCVFPEEAVLL